MKYNRRFNTHGVTSVFIFDFYNKYMSKMLFTQHLQLLTQYSQIQVFHSVLICE